MKPNDSSAPNGAKTVEEAQEAWAREEEAERKKAVEQLTQGERELASRLIHDPADTAARSQFYKMHHWAKMRRSAGTPR